MSSREVRFGGIGGVPGTVTVIVGATNNTTTVSGAGSNPRAIAVNTVTNKIYVANESGNNVTVIDGVVAADRKSEMLL